MPIRGIVGPNGEAYPIFRLAGPQTLAIGTTATSFATAVQTEVIRMTADVPINFRFATAGTATSSDHRLPSNVVEYFGVRPGEFVFAVATATGNVYLSEAI